MRQKSALDPNTMTSLLCFFYLKTIHHQYQVGIIFLGKDPISVPTWYVQKLITRTLPAQQ
jgi:hypothetical protein